MFPLEKLGEVAAWTVDQVCDYLMFCKLDTFTENFRKQKINGIALLMLTEHDVGTLSPPDITIGETKNLLKVIRDFRGEHFLDHLTLSGHFSGQSQNNGNHGQLPTTASNIHSHVAQPVRQHPTNPASIRTVWIHGDKDAISKLIFSFIYLVNVCFFTALTMVSYDCNAHSWPTVANTNSTR